MGHGMFLQESASSAGSLMGSIKPPCASTSVRTLKIASTGSHTIVWPHKNTAHTDRIG